MNDQPFLEDFRRTLHSISEIPALPKEILIRLIHRGIIRELLSYPNPHSIALLEDVCITAPIPEIREDALNALFQLSRENLSDAVLGLYRLAVEGNHSGAISFLQKHPLTSPQPELQAAFSFMYLTDDDYAQFDKDFTRLADYFFHLAQPSTRLKIIQSANSSFKHRLSNLLNALWLDQEEKSDFLVRFYPQSSQIEKRLILQQLTILADSGNTAAQNTLCRLVISYDDPAAREICLQRNYSPFLPAEKALFYFLSSQWEQYETYDFTHHWLLEAYSSASPSLRQKVLAHARTTGQIGWLSNLSNYRPALMIWELSPSDWEKIRITILSNPRDNSWVRLLNYAPLYWAAWLLAQLTAAPDVFSSEPELSEIAQQAKGCLPQPLPFPSRTVLQSPAGSNTCLAVSPFGTEVAFGSLESSIQLLSLITLEWQKPLLSPTAPTRVLAYDPQATYLVCAGGDQRIRIFRRQDYALVKTLEGHQGQIRSIIFQSDGRRVHSAGFDGRIFSWHFPSGLTSQPPIETGQEIFSLTISPDNQLLIYSSANRTCNFFPMSGGQPIHSISEMDGVPLALAVNSRQKLAIASRSATIQQFSLSTYQPLTPGRSTGSPLNHLIYHPTVPLLFGMEISGKINAWHETDLEVILESELHTQPASGLGLTPDGNLLISSSTDGKVVIWDLQPFLLYFQPIQSDLHEWIEKITGWLKMDMPISSRQWLEFALQLLHWRARFDIQIGEVEPLQIGEFDILL